MSETKVTKSKKEPKVKVKVDNEPKEKPEPKPRKSRAKVQPTKEEQITMIADAQKEMNSIISELKCEQEKLHPLGLKRMNELIVETLKNLDEDIAELDEHKKELEKPE